MTPTPVPPHLSDEERALTVPTSGPRFDFLELIRDYASALLNHPGTKRHEATLQRVLDAHDALLTALSTEREAGEKAKRAAFCAGADWATPHEMTRRDEAEAVRIAALRYPTSTESAHD